MQGTGNGMVGTRTLNAARPTTTPAAKKAKAMISQRMPHTELRKHVRQWLACVRDYDGAGELVLLTLRGTASTDLSEG